MLSFSNFSFEFGGEYLYRNTDWHIKPNERIGLIGKNGTGKSTLLKLITGDYELREGTMTKVKSLTIGYLHQDLLSFNSDESIYTVASQAFEKALAIEKEIEELIELVEKDPSEENVIKLSERQMDFERLDGYVMKSKTEEILEGLGFKTADLSRPLSEFSGGWRMRVIMARMLLSKPDLLLLDEPTNHLDLPSIKWLESYLTNYQGTVIMVSHDRDFLNRLATKMVEITQKKIFIWEGNYDFYLKAKEERDDLQARKFENQQQYIKDQEKFIDRFRAKASKAKAVQSRVKMLEKLELIEDVESDGAGISLRFAINKSPGKVIQELEGLSKQYDDNIILKDAEGLIVRDDKIALIGANGMGKSTLLRIISGTESYQGKSEVGHNVEAAIYAQHQVEQLHLENEMIEELKGHAPHKTETELRTLLGCFLFQGDDVFKKIKVLSGGEKARVALAKTLLTKANFLLLDEPTNHLDMQSIEILIEALNNYEGSFIVVSHNRYFLSRIANKVWRIENQKIKEFAGSYEEYNQWQSKREEQQITKKSPLKQAKKETPKPSRKPIDKQMKNDLRKLKKEEELLGSKIISLTDKMAALEAELIDPKMAAQHDKLFAISTEYEQLKSEKKRLQEHADEVLIQVMELEEKMDI